MPNTPKPTYEMRCYPKRNDGELDTNYQKRVSQFMQNNHYPKQQQDEWEKDKCLTFKLLEEPQNARDQGPHNTFKELIENLMNNIPLEKVTLQCPDGGDSGVGMHMLKDINAGLIKKLAEVIFSDPKEEGLKGNRLENQKTRLFPSLKGPTPR